MKFKQTTPETGSVLIYILIGVVLLAALYFAFSRNNGGGSSSMASKGSMKAKAIQVLDFSNTVTATVEKMLVQGCSETEIDFGGTTGLNWYWNNTTSPADKRCTIFSDRGGRLLRQSPPPKIGAIGGPGSLIGMYEYKGRESLFGQGTTTCDDIFIAIRGLSNEFCTAINKELGIIGIPPKQLTGATDLSGGVYAPTACGPWAGEGTWNNPVIKGKRQFCASNVGKTDNYFISVIIAR